MVEQTTLPLKSTKHVSSNRHLGNSICLVFDVICPYGSLFSRCFPQSGSFKRRAWAHVCGRTLLFQVCINTFLYLCARSSPVACRAHSSVIRCEECFTLHIGKEHRCEVNAKDSQSASQVDFLAPLSKPTNSSQVSHHIAHRCPIMRAGGCWCPLSLFYSLWKQHDSYSNTSKQKADPKE